MTIVHGLPSTRDVQPIENWCFPGSSPVWPTLCQAYQPKVVFALDLSAAYAQKPSDRLAVYTSRGMTNEVGC
jgi:hypothetical protein